MRVLVTGAGSLLLGGVVEALTARGDQVVSLQRRPIEADVEQVHGDVRDPDAVARAVRGCDAVVHGAARVGVLGTWDEFRTVNVDGTANLLDAVRRHGVGRFVHVSSPSVAHDGGSLVGATANPAVTGRRRAHYAESKALAERHVLDVAAGVSDLGIVVVRPHLVWGPGDTQLVGRIVERARDGRLALVGGGTALVDTTYVTDAVSAHVAAVDAVSPDAPCHGRAYVISGGDPRPVRELVEGICVAAGVPYAPRSVPPRVALGVGSLVERLWPRLRDDEPPITRFLAEQLGTAHWFDPRPARDDLAWHAQVAVDEGLARLGRWFTARS